jgi:zinc protease
MQFTEFEQKNIRGISLNKDGERAFHCVISIDTHKDDKNALLEATGHVYVKALLAGCKGYTREEFLNAVNLLGATISVTIDNGIVTISLTSIDTHRDKLLSLVALMLQTPTFVPAEIKRIQELEENELHEEKEDAKAQSLYTFINTLYGTTDRRFMSKTDDLIIVTKRVQKKDISKFHERAMSGRWICTVTGDTSNADTVIKKLQKLRGAFKDAKGFEAVHSTKTFQQRKIELVSIPSKQNIEFSIGGSLPLTLSDADYHAFVFGLNVLGKWGGFAGRLMSTVREKEGLTYGIYARVETVSQIEHGYWRIMTFFAPDKALQGLNSTIHQIKLIHEKGITPTEFERFKTIIGTGQALLNDSVIRRVADAHAYQVKGFTLESMKEFKKKMLDVTKEEVDAALKKYLDLSTLVIAAAGPVQAHSKELKALGSLVKEPK